MAPMSVYIAGLSEDTQKEDLEREFGRFGNLTKVWVAYNPPVFAFIDFENAYDANEAIREMNGATINGSKIRVGASHGGSQRGRGRGRGDGEAIKEMNRATINGSEIRVGASCRGSKRGRGRGRGDGSPPSTSRPGPQTQVPVVEEASALVPQRASAPKVQHINPEELGISFKRKLAFTKFPDRPGKGTLGKSIKLISNCFKLKIPSGNLYHYDTALSKKQKQGYEKQSTNLVPAEEDDKKYRCLSTKKNREVIKLMLETNAAFKNVYAVYDGQKNIYTRDPLRGNFPIKCEVIIPAEDDSSPDNPRQDIYIVQTKPAYKDDGTCAISLDKLHAFYNKTVSSVPQESIMALETILRQGPCLQFTPIGRSFFYPPTNPRDLHPLGGGLEIWFGYHQSIRLGEWGPMVNLNRTATSFYSKGPVIQFIAEVLNMSTNDLRRKQYLSALDIKRLNSKLKNIRVEVTHLKNYKRKYRIVSLTKENAHNLEFELAENGRTYTKTVAAYFKERYSRTLDYPNLPCLQVQPEKKKIYIPIEVCEIVAGQHSKKKLDPKQTSNMITFTAANPRDRFSDIKKIAENLDLNKDTHIQQFGVEVGKDPIHCEGRVLDSPTVRYKDGETKPLNGSWNMRQRRFLTGATIKSWVLLSFIPCVKIDCLNNFKYLLIKIGKELGMSIDNPTFVHAIDPSEIDMTNLLLDMKSKYKAELAVFVLPGNDKLIYGKIKQAAETVVGLSTQCIKEGNVLDQRKCNSQLVRNICQKINAKAGGENNSLVYKELPPVFSKPIIIIGADVNHPGVSEGVKPSLAACVGSLDMKLSKYAVSVRAQKNIDEKKQSVEIILDLKEMVLELLKAFYKYTNGKKPEKIIFYRDGVSEGQFDAVHDHEVKCIREACMSLPGDYKPGITFIVVRKRHHVRFMPENEKDGVGTPKNIPPGTTVDSGVIDPLKFDFFLCSHLGLKGTSRPSHYTVVEDDNKFTADDLQKMTLQLCHIYARCTKSISIPVPVAYADLAAYRARQHMEAALEDLSRSSDLSGGSDHLQPLPASIIESIQLTGFDECLTENVLYDVPLPIKVSKNMK